MTNEVQKFDYIEEALWPFAVPIDSIHPDPNSARTNHAIDKIAASLKQYKQRRLLVVNTNENNKIEAGNGTHKAAKSLGWTHIAVLFVKDDPAKAVGFALVDNKTNEESEWDFDTLGHLFGALEDDVFTGFSTDEVADILDSIEDDEGFFTQGKDADIEVEGAEEAELLREKWGVQEGQVWVFPTTHEQIGDHLLLCGDCRQFDRIQQLAGGRAFDAGLTSPPYYLDKEYEAGKTFDELLELLDGLAEGAKTLIKAGGFMTLNFDDIALQKITRMLTGMKEQCVYPMEHHYWQIFHERHGMALYAKRIWEKPFHLLGKPFYTYNTSICAHGEYEHIWTFRLNGAEGDQVYDWDISSRALWSTREDTRERPLAHHVAAFPVTIPERIMRAHSAVGALIWEPLNGSGSTIIAGENLCRQVIASELRADYVAVSLERYEDYSGNKPYLMD